MTALPYLVAAFVLLCGLAGIVTSRNLVHLVTCLGVCQTSTWLFFLAIGYQRGGAAPIAAGAATAPRVDAVVQAMALTDIVVGAVVTALLLALAIQAEKRFHSLDPDEIRRIRG